MQRTNVLTSHLSGNTGCPPDSKIREFKGNGTYFSEEWELRKELAAAFRIAGHFGWDQVIFNHITAKVPHSEDVPGGPHFLINPFGYGFDEITASSLIKVDTMGNVVDAGSWNGRCFLQGFIIHSALHMARKDCKCVWHNHQSDVSAVTMTKEGLLPLSQEALFVLAMGVSFHPFEGSTTELDERERLVKSLGEKNRVLLLENHGPCICSKSVAEAFTIMYNLDLACRYQVKALAAVGGDIKRLRLPKQEDLSKMMKRGAKTSLEEGKKQPAYNSTQLSFDRMLRVIENIYGAENIYI